MKQRKHFLTGLVAGLCALAPALADVPIDPTVTGSRQIVLDHHQDTGNYFAVVRGADPIDVWALYISTDQGASWSSMEDVTTSGDWIDVDIAVAGDYVYAGYAMASFGEAGIARFFAADGSFDSVYGYRSLIDVFPTDVVDVALASDQDGADNEIYYAFIASDGALRFFFDASADGTTCSASGSRAGIRVTSTCARGNGSACRNPRIFSPDKPPPARETFTNFLRIHG